jgi:putative sigma-54 modulation protein
MRVIVKARHMNLTPSLREHAEEKLGKALMRIFDRPAAQIEIELNDIGNVRDGANKECRVTVFMPRGKTINIVEIDDDMYKAIDLAHDRVLQQVKRQRERRRNMTQQRKSAERSRARTARDSLTVAMEPWEREVEEFERASRA